MMTGDHDPANLVMVDFCRDEYTCLYGDQKLVASFLRLDFKLTGATSAHFIDSWMARGDFEGVGKFEISVIKEDIETYCDREFLEDGYKNAVGPRIS